MNRFTTNSFDKKLKLTGIIGVLICLFASMSLQAQTCGTPKALTTSNFPGTTVSVSTYEGACLLCGPQNSGNLINSNTTDYAEMRFGASLGAKNILGVKAPVTFPAGTFAGMAYNPQIGTFTLVGLDILGNIKVSTYLNGQEQESQTSNNLINGDILDFFGGRNTIGFTTQLPFDEIRIEQTATIGLLSNSAVYHAVVQSGCFDFAGCPTNATVETGNFVANSTAGQNGTITVPIQNAAAGPVNVTVSGGGFTTTPAPYRTLINQGQTHLTLPLTYNGTGAVGNHLVSVNVVTANGVVTCTVNVPVSAAVTPAPTVSNSPNPLVVGQAGTLTASGCTGGTVTWYNNGTQVGTGSPLAVANVPASASYTATCTISGVVSAASTPITTASQPAAPSISSNPNPPVAGQSVTLSATGCAGTLTWYNNGTQVGSGASFTTTVPASPVANYTATCTVNGVASVPSTTISAVTGGSGSDLAVAFTTNPGSSFVSGTSKSYIVTVRNVGTSPSQATTLSISSAIGGFSVSGGGSQSIGVLAAGGQQTFSISVTGNNKGSAGALSAVIPGSADSNSSNNSASVPVAVAN